MRYLPVPRRAVRCSRSVRVLETQIGSYGRGGSALLSHPPLRDHVTAAERMIDDVEPGSVGLSPNDLG